MDAGASDKTLSNAEKLGVLYALPVHVLRFAYGNLFDKGILQYRRKYGGYHAVHIPTDKDEDVKIYLRMRDNLS